MTAAPATASHFSERATIRPIGIKPITELTTMPVVPRIENRDPTIAINSDCFVRNVLMTLLINPLMAPVFSKIAMVPPVNRIKK